MTAPLDRLAAALADRYRIERELGQGGMATVTRVLAPREGTRRPLPSTESPPLLADLPPHPADPL